MRFSNKGASGTEYGLLLALLGAVAVVTVFVLGQETKNAFETADESLQVSLASSQTEISGGSTPAAAEEPQAVCFVESGGDSTNIFTESDGYNCFEVATGIDELTVTSDERLTVLAESGSKEITLTGAGPHEVSLVDASDSSVIMSTGVLTGLNSSAQVIASGALEITATGAASAGWILDLTDEDDSVSMSGARLEQAAFGNGSNSLNLTNAAPRQTYGALDFGTDSNSVSLSCQNGLLNWSSNLPYAMSSVGNFTGSFSNCPMELEFPYQSSRTGELAVSPSIDLISSSPSSNFEVDQKGPTSGVNISGAVSGYSSIRLETMNGRQTGSSSVNLSVTDDFLVPGPNGNRALVSVYLIPDRAQNSNAPDVPSAQSTSVSIDTSDVVSSGEDSYVVSTIIYATSNHSVSYTGGGSGTRIISVGFGDPSTYPNTGVPSLSSDAPVDLVLRTKGCWAVTLHAKAGSGFSDVTHPAGDCAYYNTTNTPAVSNNLASYEGASLYPPSGGVLELGFNGGSFANGSTLNLNSIVFGNESNDDSATPGGAL